MLKNILTAFSTLLTFFTAGQSCTAQTELSAEQVYEIVNKSVVMIILTDGKGNEDQGSGVVIMDGSYIATCCHLIADSKKITVVHQNMEFKNAELIYKDEQKDIAILKISPGSLTPIKPDSSENLKPGQKVYAVSSPEGYENTISEGIISGLRKETTTLIQSTAPITEGSSGGALVNSKGELIGILSSGQHEGNLYFAVPVSEILKLQLQLQYSDAKIESDKQVEIEEDYFKEGLKATEDGNYTEAVNLFSKHLEKNSKDDLAYFSRGKVYGKLKDYKHEIHDYTAALQLNPDFEEAYNCRGMAYRQLEDYEDAVKDYLSAIKLNPDYSEAYFNRGVAYYYLNDFESAVKDYSKVIELNPDFANTYYNRGYAYKQWGKIKKAVSDFETAVKLNPEYDKKLRQQIEEMKKGLK